MLNFHLGFSLYDRLGVASPREACDVHIWRYILCEAIHRSCFQCECCLKKAPSACCSLWVSNRLSFCFTEGKTPLPEPPATAPAEAAPVAEENLPLREDFIQNAVKFLSHPKVQGSPVQYRRSFLEKKGLNNAEITEAFRRVPVSGALQVH